MHPLQPDQTHFQVQFVQSSTDSETAGSLLVYPSPELECAQQKKIVTNSRLQVIVPRGHGVNLWPRGVFLKFKK